MTHSNDLYLLRNGVYTKVVLEHIIYVRSFDNYCRFVMVGGDVFVIRKTLKNAARILERHGFIQCHRQFIINSKLVISIDILKREIHLQDGHIVRYSRRRKKEVLNRLMDKY